MKILVFIFCTIPLNFMKFNFCIILCIPSESMYFRRNFNKCEILKQKKCLYLYLVMSQFDFSLKLTELEISEKCHTFTNIY